MNLRLSIFIPLLLILLSLLGSLGIYQQEVHRNFRDIREDAQKDLLLDMGLLQNQLYNQLTEGDEVQGQLSLSLMAMRPQVRRLLLVNDSHRILLADQFSLKQQLAADHSEYDPATAELVIRRGVTSAEYQTPESGVLHGYFPVVVAYLQGGLEKISGVLYVEMDVSSRLQEASQDAFRQSAIYAAINLAVALLIAWLLHRLVSHRVNLLLDSSSQLARGNYSIQTRLEGNDELSRLASNFDAMARSVRDNMQYRDSLLQDQRRVVQTALDGYWEVDARGQLTDVNDAYCRMSGYSREELLQMGIPQLEAKEQTPEEVRAHMEHIFHNGHDRFESIHQRKDGSLFDVEVSTTWWQDKKQFYVFIRDITERKRAEILLQQERLRLKEAQKVGHFGSWELDLVKNTLTWSDEIFAIFEIDQQQFAASYEAFLNSIHPDDRDRVNQAYTRSLEDRQPYQITHRLRMRDGRIKWVEERCSSDFDLSGKPLRSIGTVQDVTERERLAEQARIAAVAFETQEAILVTDRNANILKVNHAFEKITGFSAEEVIGKNPSILSSGRHGPEFYQEMWRQINEEGRWSGEIWDHRKDGGIYLKWMTITSVKYQGEITHYVAVFVDITERKRAEEEIRSLAFYDPLTSLPNRRLLLDRLHLAMGQSGRNGHFGALMFLDLDHFKVLNDTKGHEYGDLMLIEVANRLNDCVRETDVVARFGGDEFVVLLEGLNPERDEAVAQAGKIAEKMRHALSQPFYLKNEHHLTSPSIGVVLFQGEAVPMEELLKQADLAMYQAKEGGRNLVRFFEPSMQAILEARTSMENALRLAMAKQELFLSFQLQTNERRELLGAEVLLRWRSEVLGMVPPSEFIPLAEKTKLILPIGKWVLESACLQLKAWEAHPVLGKLRLAVNISPVQFHQPEFVRQVKHLLQQTGADPRKLELELTENLVLENVEEATGKMLALKECGVRFSMDDFGTGYSSLQYIKRLPIDQLKIDQSFVRDILNDAGDAMMVQTIAGMARSFGFEVIAEGVETAEQLSPLVQRGCSNFQGFLFARPLPAGEFEKLIDDWKRKH